MDGTQSGTSAATPDISGPIARFAVGTRGAAMPESARTIAKLSLLDWCAVALAGTGEPVSRATRALVAEEAGVPQATVIGHDRKLPARAAALANGATSHALDYDDTHFDHVGHTSVGITPAVLAMAEKIDASGAAVIEAALVGHETAIRIGTWLGTGHYNFGFHQTATAGTFGAAAASARLLGLDEERTRHALGIAATRASGLKSQFGTMGKPYHAGMAAANGVEAALLATLGFVSRPDGIECAQGFGVTHAGEGRDLAAVLAGLGSTYRFEAVQYKFHACCHGTHAAIEALKALRERNALALDDVTGVTLGVNPRWLKVCNIERPATGLEAKFSYRLTTAMALAGVETGALDVYDEATCRRADLVRVRDAVTVAPDAVHADTAALVRVETRSGKTLEAHFDLETPMSVETKERKLREKAAALVGPQTAEALWRVISRLETLRAADLAALLSGRAG
jgi:2-methylcitrate dehydratase PrpD